MSKRSTGKQVTGDELVGELFLKPGKHANLADRNAGRTLTARSITAKPSTAASPKARDIEGLRTRHD